MQKTNHGEEIEISEQMERLLLEVRKCPFPTQEKTFFDIEGIIGRLEVPTTKLLRFFIEPDGGHDLGTLFLRAFFACLKTDCSDISFDGAKNQQLQTDDNKFLDLVISGSGWVSQEAG